MMTNGLLEGRLAVITKKGGRGRGTERERNRKTQRVNKLWPGGNNSAASLLCRTSTVNSEVHCGPV